MCMESRKMVPMKLFAGQQWRYRQNRLVDTVWEEEGGWTERVASVQFSSVQFSCSVMSNSLLPQGLQHPRPPCPSPIPGACSNMSIESVIPSTISSSVVPFSSHLESFPASGSFQMSQRFTSGDQSIGV